MGTTSSSIIFMQATKMKPNTLKIINAILESGVTAGIARAYKHDDKPGAPFITSCIEDAVDLRMSEAFSFEESYETKIDLNQIRELAARDRAAGYSVGTPSELYAIVQLLDSLLDLAQGEAP
jgi:hypothetical protein